MLHTIAETFKKNQDRIETFLKEKSAGLVPPLYLSCDIRNSGKKLGVIDTNLFPAGFNNLCNSYSRIVAKSLKYYFNKYYKHIDKIMILAEEHTRNRYYLENIHRLLSLFQGIGMEVRIAYPGFEIAEEKLQLTLNPEQTLTMEKLRVENGVPQVGNWEADLVVSNNDFSQGLPENLEPLLDKIIPSPGLGWHRRRKSQHFKVLGNLIEEFANHLDLDPWWLACLFQSTEVGGLNQGESLERLAKGVEQTLGDIEQKYQQYDITEPPYVFIKNDSGTYGMGLMEVSSAEEVLQLNRRSRNKLQSAKGGNPPQSFLIQEGIPTADFYSNLPIEPVIYMVGFEVVGGFFRMNAQKDAMSSLNTKGMIFSCLCLHQLDEPHEDNFINCAEKESLVKLSSVMARIAAIAAAKESTN